MFKIIIKIYTSPNPDHNNLRALSLIEQMTHHTHTQLNSGTKIQIQIHAHLYIQIVLRLISIYIYYSQFQCVSHPTYMQT